MLCMGVLQRGHSVDGCDLASPLCMIGERVIYLLRVGKGCDK